MTEVVDLDGLRVTLVDTAGLRDTQDLIEAEGVERSHGRRQSGRSDTDRVRWITTAETSAIETLTSQIVDNKALIVVNKQDLRAAVDRDGSAVPVSATTGCGTRRAAAPNRRGARCRARRAIGRRSRTSGTSRWWSGRTTRSLRARTAALADGGALPEEFVLADLQDARAALEEITGRRAPEDVLAHIFARFCIGK